MDGELFSIFLYLITKYSNDNAYSIIILIFLISNKREVTLTDFEKKIHPPRTFPPSTFIDFLDFFHPPLHIYCILYNSFFQKIPPSTFIPTSMFIDFATFAAPSRLFQPPRLLLERWEYLSIFSSNSKSVRTLICVLWGCSSDPVPEYVVWQIQSWLPFPHTNELLWNNRPSTWRVELPPQTRLHISPSMFE